MARSLDFTGFMAILLDCIMPHIVYLLSVGLICGWMPCTRHIVPQGFKNILEGQSWILSRA